MSKRAVRTSLEDDNARAPPTALSGYRIMWVFVLFDLPVGTKKERKAANGFRHVLFGLQY